MISATSDEVVTSEQMYTDSDGAILTVTSEQQPPHSSQIHRNAVGELHRLDGPAKERHGPSGKLSGQHWFLNGKLHRLDGPSSETWWPNGQLAVRQWHLNGKLHHLNGPASETWNKNGQLAELVWWVRGEQLRADDRLRAAVNPATPPKRLARLARSVDHNVAAFAAHNPACPTAAKVMYSLTHPPASM